MRSLMPTRRRTTLLALSAVLAMAADASAVLVNKYTFNDGTVADSVGGQHGSVVDPSGIAFYTGGQVRLTNNNGANSNQDFTNPATVGAYVDLPNGILNSAANGGDQYAFSLEMWATVQENRGWARLLDFSDVAPGQLEDTSTGGTLRNYILIAPSAGIEGAPFLAATHSGTGDEARAISPNGALPTGVEQHIVVTVDQLDSTAGANGTMNLYLNNSLIASAPVEPTGEIDFTFINDVNNWLGRAQWGDPLFDGSFNEFRIYNHALDASEVASSFTAGAEPGELAVPTLVVDRATGEMMLTNQTGEQLRLVSYSITSEAGALDTVGWDSINQSGSFDPNGNWVASSTTETLIAEADNGDGGVISAGGDASIGLAWNPSRLEDVGFTFTLQGGTQLTGEVQYLNFDGGFARSDLDVDGDVDADDFDLFALNSGVDLSGLSAYELAIAGDLNGDGTNDYQDFRLFKSDFIAANGAAAFVALGAGAAPEPGSALLLLLGAGLATAARCARS